VTQDEQGLIIIDQHALHERVLFEELRRRVLGRNLESQRLLTPAVVRTSPQRLALLESLKPLLARIGVEADALGPDAVAIHAFPSFLFDRRVDPVDFFEGLLDLAEDSQLLSTGSGVGDSSAHVDEAVLHRVLDMMACKAAVKAGDPLSPVELQSLLVLREQVERASSCPHGRPTTVRLTLQEMARRFKRT
jgi:DNA mismatch repair protein MutL